MRTVHPWIVELLNSVQAKGADHVRVTRLITIEGPATWVAHSLEHASVPKAGDWKATGPEGTRISCVSLVVEKL